MLIFFQHFISRVAGFLADRPLGWVTQYFIRWFVHHYKVNMEEAEKSIKDYKTFNAFFTRRLKKEARPIKKSDGHIISPVDGVISEYGIIHAGKLLQAKGMSYTLTSLLANDATLVDTFEGGSFATFYLSPKDYHRVHMPCDGRLIQTYYIPGSLFSVSTKSAGKIPNLFTRNERAICVFDTSHGAMAMILVGAIIVGSIHTQRHGHLRTKVLWYQKEKTQISFSQGDEMGHFQLGSTVIVLFPKGRIGWRPALTGSVKLADIIAQRLN